MRSHGRARVQSIRSELQSAGYVDIGHTDPAVSTFEVARKVAAEIGAVVSEPTERLNANAAGSKPLNTYGGNYGCGELPLHTDLAHWYRPPRYVLLRCIVGTASVSTRLLNHRKLERRISPATMRRALFSPRRRLDGKIYLLRMLTEELFRWDQLFLKAQNAAAREVNQLMHELASDLPVSDVLLLSAGHTLLIDNWQSLHGRSAVPTGDTGRTVDRVYLELSAHDKQNPA